MIAWAEAMCRVKTLREGKIGDATFIIGQGEYVSNWHLQFYIEFATVWNKRAVIELLDGVGIEHCRIAKSGGSRKENITYVTKAESRWGDADLRFEFRGNAESEPETEHNCGVRGEYLWHFRRVCGIHYPEICGCEEFTDHKNFVKYNVMTCKHCGEAIGECLWGEPDLSFDYARFAV